MKHPLVKDGRPISCLWWVSPGTLLPRVWQKDFWPRTIYHSSPSLSGDTPKSNPSLVSCMCKRMRYLIMSLPESLVDLTPIANDLANVATLPTKSSDLKFHVYLGFKNCASLTRCVGNGACRQCGKVYGHSSGPTCSALCNACKTFGQGPAWLEIPLGKETALLHQMQQPSPPLPPELPPCVGEGYCLVLVCFSALVRMH